MLLYSKQSSTPSSVIGWLAAISLTACTFSAAASAGTPDPERSPVTLAPLLAKVLPAVVSIRVIGQRQVITELKPGMVPPAPKTQPFKAGGSGVIFEAEQGLIGTNHHVIKDAVAISVGLHD